MATSCICLAEHECAGEEPSLPVSGPASRRLQAGRRRPQSQLGRRSEVQDGRFGGDQRSQPGERRRPRGRKLRLRGQGSRRDRGDAAVRAGALLFLQPDVCKPGGVSRVLAVALSAESAAGLTCCPHFLGGGIGLLASAHLLSAVGGGGLLEVGGSENPLLEMFGGLALDDSAFALPPGPGLGPEPDVDAAREMLVSRVEVRL